GGGSVLVSATNGKTRTASMLAGALERAEFDVVRNRAGSNMNWGVATALLDAGRRPGELGVFEVDEAWLVSVAAELEPRMLVLGNLFRDQLDRYGELETIADRWEELAAARDGLSDPIPVAGRNVSILLVKNPAGANEVLRTLTLEDGSFDLWLALNDGIADGRDVSWIWDADFEMLAGRVRRVTCSGTRAEEMALRLKY